MLTERLKQLDVSASINGTIAGKKDWKKLEDLVDSLSIKKAQLK